MDTRKDCMIPECGISAEFAEKRFVVGAKQLRKALRSGQAVFVYLAKNADPALTGALAAACEENQVSYAWVPTMQELGRACGIDVGAAAAAVVE